MSNATETIIEYLREAHGQEEASAGMLHGHLRGTPPGPYRSAVRRHLDETRRHAHQIEDRLTDLGATDGVLRTGLTLVEGIAGRVAGIALGPVNLIVSRTTPDALLRNLQDAIATEAREVATYEAIELLAVAGGDEVTASLARTIRADEERALASFRELVGPLADRVVRERIGVSVPVETAEDADADGASADDDTGARSDSWADDGPQARPSPQAPSSNGGPVPTDEPSRGEVARMRERMREDEAAADEDAVASAGSASPGAQIRIDAPWEGYDGMTATQVVARLREADPATVAVVRLYEQANKGRKSILNATETAQP